MNKSPFENFIDNSRKLLVVDILIIIPFLLLPLFIKLPYRVNIFLSWEGAYRLYLGQVPFVDFGLPMGFGYWLIPAAFFKIFGPAFLSLIKAQVLINLISLVSLRGILYNLKIKPIAITISLLIFCLTYVIYNFWPWYNHSVVVYELVALYFLTCYDLTKSKKRNMLNLAFAGFFTFISFFTKQDVGGICFVICLFFLAYIIIRERVWYPLIIYTAIFTFTAILLIAPFLKHDFLYWFNYGQAPHNSRISSTLLLDILFSRSLLEKVYLLVILGGVIINFSSWHDFISNKNIFFITIISTAFILQSLVTRATSPLPTDHMTYYHTFGFVGIAGFLPWEKWIKFPIKIAGAMLLIIASYSEGYWKYVSGIFFKVPTNEVADHSQSMPWTRNSLPTLKNVLLPVSTNNGIARLMKSPISSKKDLKVLNMTELTSLAKEIGYTPLTGQPLWYHLNIGMFQKQVEEINEKVKAGYYDLILFESIPSLNNFYPYEVLDAAKQKYFHFDSFLAPRRLEDSSIDVFINPDLAEQLKIMPN
jgi:hypothetical protein